MKIAVTRHTISNWYFILVLLALGVCTYLVMPDMDNTAEAGSGMSFLAIACLSALQFPLLIYIIYERYQTQPKVSRHIPRFVLYYVVFFIWMTLVSVLTNETLNIFGKAIAFMTLILYPLLLICSYFRGRTSKLDIWFYLAVLFLMVCIIVQYGNVYDLANQLSDESSHIAVSYFPLFVLPILLLPSSRIVKFISIAITAIIIISAVKRGGLIAMGASLVVYVFVKQIVSKVSTTKKVMTISAMIILMCGALYYLGEVIEENNIIERIMNIKDDGGSDRDILWKDTYNNIQNRDFGFRMMGNGFRSAQIESAFQLPAHNDVLEICYDFGIIGLGLYSIAFLSLCVYAFRLLKRKSRYAPHLAMILCYYFIFSMISIVILYFWLAILMFSIGIIAGLADTELEELQKQNSITKANKDKKCLAN